jgi:hypothetical protein
VVLVVGAEDEDEDEEEDAALDELTCPLAAGAELEADGCAAADEDDEELWDVLAVPWEQAATRVATASIPTRPVKREERITVNPFVGPATLPGRRVGRQVVQADRNGNLEDKEESAGAPVRDEPKGIT